MRRAATVPSETTIMMVLDEVAHATPWGRERDIAWALIVASGSEAFHRVAALLVRRAHELVAEGEVPAGNGRAEDQRQTALLQLALGRTSTIGGTTGARARSLFDRFVGFSPSDQFALALVTLSADHVLEHDPASLEGLTAMRRSSRLLHQPRLTDPWLWPEPQPDPLDGLLPEALMAAGTRLGQGALVHNGLALLDWRLAFPLDDESAAPTARLRDATALFEACRRAQQLTRDDRWVERVTHRAVSALDHVEARKKSAEVDVDLTTTTTLMHHHLEAQVQASRRRPEARLGTRVTGGWGYRSLPTNR